MNELYPLLMAPVFQHGATTPWGGHMLRDAIMKEIPFGGCHIGFIGPIVGCCVGPGTLIAFCMGKEVTTNAR